MSFVNDLRVAFRSLTRTKGLALTVVLTLALGIGANAAIFTLVRGVLLKPLVNRDEDRLVYKALGAELKWGNPPGTNTSAAMRADPPSGWQGRTKTRTNERSISESFRNSKEFRAFDSRRLHQFPNAPSGPVFFPRTARGRPLRKGHAAPRLRRWPRRS